MNFRCGFTVGIRLRWLKCDDNCVLDFFFSFDESLLKRVQNFRWFPIEKKNNDINIEWYQYRKDDYRGLCVEILRLEAHVREGLLPYKSEGLFEASLKEDCSSEKNFLSMCIIKSNLFQVKKELLIFVEFNGYICDLNYIISSIYGNDSHLDRSLCDKNNQTSTPHMRAHPTERCRKG